MADLTTQIKVLRQKVNDMLSLMSVGTKVRFGSTSQKDIHDRLKPLKVLLRIEVVRKDVIMRKRLRWR